MDETRVSASLQHQDARVETRVLASLQHQDARVKTRISAALQRPRREGQNPRLSIIAVARREGQNPRLSITSAQNPCLGYNCPRYWVNYCLRNEGVNPHYGAFLGDTFTHETSINNPIFYGEEVGRSDNSW